MILELLFLAGLLLLSVLLVPFFVPFRIKSKLPPGPMPLPIIGNFHLLGPLIHRSFHKLSLRYGPLFSLRLGSVPCVVVSSPEYAKVFLQNNELSFTSRGVTIAITRIMQDTFVFAPYGPYWKFVKKLSTNELLGSRRTINSFLSLREKEYHRLLRFLDKKSETGEVVNFTEALLHLTNAIISQMIIGQSEEAGEVIRDVSQILGEFNSADYIWFCKYLDLQGMGKRIEDIRRKFDAFSEKIITERVELRNKKKNGKADGEHEQHEVKDFMDILLDFVEDENSDMKLTKAHLKSLIVDFFSAGTETTATITEWAVAELINNPKVLEKARQEIHSVVQNNRLVKESDIPNLPYIEAIMKETLRLHPPVPLVPRKCIKDCEIGNFVITTNTLLFVNVWAIGRDPKYWKNPLDFQPERFLPSDADSGFLDFRGQHFHYFPFGSGRRMCPGINLVVQEVPALLAALIQCFDFKVVGPPGKSMDGKDVVVDTQERSGITVPRAHDLVCVPITRFKPLDILD